MSDLNLLIKLLNNNNLAIPNLYFCVIIVILKIMKINWI